FHIGARSKERATMSRSIECNTTFELTEFNYTDCKTDFNGVIGYTQNDELPMRGTAVAKLIT
ncbi:MAG: hypothetical protein ABSH41_31615, partial [Syntrophobacteraceae bacterium]